MSSVYFKVANPFLLDQIIGYIKKDYNTLDLNQLTSIKQYTRDYAQEIFREDSEDSGMLLGVQLQYQALERIRELLIMNLVHNVTNTNSTSSIEELFNMPHPKTGITLLEYAFFGRAYDLLDLFFEAGARQSNLSGLEFTFRKKFACNLNQDSNPEIEIRNRLLNTNFARLLPRYTLATPLNLNEKLKIGMTRIWKKNKFLFISVVLGGIIAIVVAPFTGGLAPIFYSIGLTSLMSTSISVWQASSYQIESTDLAEQSNQNDSKETLLKCLLKEVERTIKLLFQSRCTPEFLSEKDYELIASEQLNGNIRLNPKEKIFKNLKTVLSCEHALQSFEQKPAMIFFSKALSFSTPLNSESEEQLLLTNINNTPKTKHH